MILSGVVAVLYGAVELFVADAGSASYISQSGDSNGPQIGQINGPVTIQQNGVGTATPAPQPEIVGRWDAQLAVKVARDVFRRRIPDACFEDVCDPHYSLFGEYNLPYKSRQVMLLVFILVDKENECHRCGVSLSFFEFEKLSSGWKLVTDDIDALRLGSWGILLPELFRIHVIGDDIFGVIYESDFMEFAITDKFTSIHAKIGDHYREVLNLRTARNSSANTSPIFLPVQNWTSELTFRTGTGGFYDLLVKRTGKRDDNEFPAQEIFKYDGQRYTASGTFR